MRNKKSIKSFALLWGAKLQPYLYVSLAVIIVGTLILYPLIKNIINSLSTDQQFLAGGEISFVGFENYKNAWKQGLLQIALKNSFMFTIITVIASFISGFGAALLINFVNRGKAIYRVLIALPWVISPIVAGIAWNRLLAGRFGYVNYALQKIGIISEPIAWLANTDTALPSVIVANIWRVLPFTMIILLAGLKGVSKELEESAVVYGAGPWQVFRHVTVPQMKKIIVIVVLLNFTWNFNQFDIVQVMTKGGPINSTMVLPVLIKKLAFDNLRIGTASALAIILAVILLVLSVLYLAVIERDERS